MFLFIDYNTLKIKNIYDSDICGTRILYTSIDKIIHTPNGFYMDDTILESDDIWFNEFIKTQEYKNHMRKVKLEKLYIK